MKVKNSAQRSKTKAYRVTENLPLITGNKSSSTNEIKSLIDSRQNNLSSNQIQKDVLGNKFLAERLLTKFPLNNKNQ